MYWIIALIIILTGAGGGIFYYLRRKKANQLSPLPSSFLRQVQTFQAWPNHLPGDEEVNLAKSGLFIGVAEHYGLLWAEGTGPGLGSPSISGTIRPDTIIQGLAKRERLKALNPNIKLLIDVGYTEGSVNPNNFPEDHPWWKRDAQGNHVLGWPFGNPVPYLFNLDLADVRQHCADSVVNALSTGVFDGVFLDVFSDDPNHVDILVRIRRQLPNALIWVNCNYRICPNVAPLVNGFYMECGDKAPWDQVIATLDFNERHVIQPAMNLLEISGSRDDVKKMTATTCLMLTHGNGYVLYSDPITHQHARHALWDLDLGKPVAAPTTKGATSFRRFERGHVNFAPPPATSFIQML